MINRYDEQFFKIQLKWAADAFDAERTVSGVLPARVARGPALRVAELARANWVGLKREAQQHAQGRPGEGEYLWLTL